MLSKENGRRTSEHGTEHRHAREVAPALQAGLFQRQAQHRVHIVQLHVDMKPNEVTDGLGGSVGSQWGVRHDFALALDYSAGIPK
jgi:hypothetical protein